MVDSSANKQNPEQAQLEMIKGMRQLEQKNIIQNLQSKNKDWDQLLVPKEIQSGLLELSYSRPSIIQSVSLRHILDNPTNNYAFQAINGSGKTGAFIVPSLMKVKKELPKIQIVIFGNTRELIRQIYQVGCRINKDLQVKIALGEQSAKLEGAQILVTTPGFLKQCVNSRTGPLDLSSLQMIVYDEADELFIQDQTVKDIDLIFKKLAALNVKHQNVLFSATFNDTVVDRIKSYVGDTIMFPIQKESLKLKGVKNFKIMLSKEAKMEFALQLHTDLVATMTMVFVNQKNSAHTLAQQLKNRNIEAKVLTGDLDHTQRDGMIDDFRRNNFTTLISTNVLARGIDVPEVDLVISFDVPFLMEHTGWKEPDYANYMHRVGRTGRFGTDGIAVQIMCNEDEVEFMSKIEKYYEIQIHALKDFHELVQAIQAIRGQTI